MEPKPNNGERVIVDVRDLFGLPRDSAKSNRRQTQVEDDVEETTKRFTPASNTSDIFFGPSKPLMKTNRQPASDNAKPLNQAPPKTTPAPATGVTPQLPPPGNTKIDSKTTKPASDSGNDEMEYEDDECTLDLAEEEWEEDDEGEGRPKHLFRQYEGEDFAQYIEDSEDAKPKRRLRKKKAPKAPISPDSSASSGERSVRSTLRKKLGTLFRSGGSKGRQTILPNGSIHNFSYADSKIGIAETNGSTKATNNVINGGSSQEMSGKRTKQWWTRETLSAHKMTGNSEVLLGTRRSTSIPYHLDSVGTQNPAGDSDSGFAYTTTDSEAHEFEQNRINKIQKYVSSPKSNNRKTLWQTVNNARGKKNAPEDDLGPTVINPLLSRTLEDPLTL